MIKPPFDLYDPERQVAAVDELLEPFQERLGDDFDGYRNHCRRVFLFAVAFAGKGGEMASRKIAVASAFHDLGIWTEGTFDYLEPSRQLAVKHLEAIGREEWSDEIEAMIELHHKIRPYRSNFSWLVEPFRKADWIDISKGMLRYRLDDGYVVDVLDAFPNAGFHQALVRLGLERLKSHPFNPLPMFRI
ncbi:MAG TPA: HD domain-containing protein [Chlorobaculum sp.]|nr:HD domain-containing protein [Chlorobaculum sp.]